MPILEVVVPDEIGEVEECLVVTWFKRAGDQINKDDPLVILQAEKIAIEVPAPATGQVTAILAQQGEVVKKGQVLARLETAGAKAPAPPPPVEAPAPAAPRRGPVRASPIARRLAREHNIDLSQVPAGGKGGRITEKDVLAFIQAQQAGPPAEAPPREMRASPVAKRLAREHNINLAQVTGTGKGGRITGQDVLDFIEKSRPAVEPELEAAAPTQTLPLAGIRGSIARRMVESLHSMAQLTLHTEADVTGMVALRERLKQQAPITYTDLLVRACALALRRHPRLNATLTGQTIHLLPHINIGLAVALDDGLIVPVIPNADRQSLSALAQTRLQLVERARNGQLTPEEVSGATFTVTNLGPYDVDAFTPIINPPEAAILGVGRIMEKVVIYQGKIAQRSMMTLSLTFDHRLVDGAPAAAFLQTIKQLLETPDQLA